MPKVRNAKQNSVKPKLKVIKTKIIRFGGGTLSLTLIARYERNQNLAWGYQAAGEILIQAGVKSSDFVRKYVKDNFKDLNTKTMLQAQDVAIGIIRTVGKAGGLPNAAYAEIGAVCLGISMGYNNFNEHILAPQIMELNPYYYSTNIDRTYTFGGSFGGGGAGGIKFYP